MLSLTSLYPGDTWASSADCVEDSVGTEVVAMGLYVIPMNSGKPFIKFHQTYAAMHILTYLHYKRSTIYHHAMAATYPHRGQWTRALRQQSLKGWRGLGL